MAKSATKGKTAAPTGTGTKATSAAVRRAPTKPTAAKAKASEGERPKAKDTATIKIDKGAGRRGKVDVGVNGRIHKLPVDKEIEVNAGVYSALADSNVSFTTIDPLAGGEAGEGSSASSTIGGTAIRAEEPETVAPKADEEVQELVQEDEKN